MKGILGVGRPWDVNKVEGKVGPRPRIFLFLFFPAVSYVESQATGHVSYTMNQVLIFPSARERLLCHQKETISRGGGKELGATNYLFRKAIVFTGN